MAVRTLSVAEAADQLGVSDWLLYDLIRRGQSPVPILRMGRRIRIAQAALDRVLEAGNFEVAS
jgi:excisionase family DNA binding protein